MKVKKLFEHIIRARKFVFKRNKVTKGTIQCAKQKPKVTSQEKGTWKKWRTLSLGLAVPMVVVGTLLNIILVAMCGEMHGPPFVPYEYMYRRVKRFPWGDGDKSFFHNPDANALPDGYEPGRGPTRRYREGMDEQDGSEEGGPQEGRAQTEGDEEDEELCKCK